MGGEAKTMILTGDVAVDNHCQPSTLGGETAELVDRFRQLKLKEYDDICKMCKDKNVPFTEDLLKKGTVSNLCRQSIVELYEQSGVSRKTLTVSFCRFFLTPQDSLLGFTIT